MSSKKLSSTKEPSSFQKASLFQSKKSLIDTANEATVDAYSKKNVTKSVKNLRRNKTVQNLSPKTQLKSEKFVIKTKKDKEQQNNEEKKQLTTSETQNTTTSSKQRLTTDNDSQKTNPNTNIPSGTIDEKKFIIKTSANYAKGPNHYDKMKLQRAKAKEETQNKTLKLHEPPNSKFAFETMLKRSKALKEFFNEKTDEDFATSYLNKNWHFLTSFECFLFEMVKQSEITKEFDSQTNKASKKIEKFIMEKVEHYISFSAADKNLKLMNNKINKIVKNISTKKLQKKNQYENYFNDYI